MLRKQLLPANAHPFSFFGIALFLTPANETLLLLKGGRKFDSRSESVGEAEEEEVVTKADWWKLNGQDLFISLSPYARPGCIIYMQFAENVIDKDLICCNTHFFKFIPSRRGASFSREIENQRFMKENHFILLLGTLLHLMSGSESENGFFCSSLSSHAKSPWHDEPIARNSVR